MVCERRLGGLGMLRMWGDFFFLLFFFFLLWGSLYCSQTFWCTVNLSCFTVCSSLNKYHTCPPCHLTHLSQCAYNHIIFKLWFLFHYLIIYTLFASFLPCPSTPSHHKIVSTVGVAGSDSTAVLVSDVKHSRCAFVIPWFRISQFLWRSPLCIHRELEMLWTKQSFLLACFILNLY